VDEEPPITVPAPLDPMPIPDPGTVWAPIGECPLEAELLFGTGVVHVRLEDPCEEGQYVPFLFREQNKIPGRWDEYTLIVEGFVFDGEGVRILIPYENRANRYEIVDDRDGTVIASIQNYRLREVR
jgi:hypothetical protein